jgi:hypothetical protein
VFANRARELDERFQPRSGCPRQPGVQALLSFLERQPVDVAQLAVEQERAVHSPVSQHDLGELEQLARGLLGGILEQAVAGALDPLALAAGRAAVLVVLVAADLVGRLAAELDNVKRVEHDLRVRHTLLAADRVLIAGGHVDRNGPDRGLLLVREPVEERLQAAGVAALGSPHDPARLVVRHAGQELVIGAVAHLVDADQLKAVQPAGGELLGDDPLEDVADRLPADPHQSRDLRLVHLLRQPRGQIVEVAGVPRIAARPLDVLGQIAAARTVEPAQPALDPAPQAAHIEMSPALDAVILDLQPARPAARADRPLAAQTDHHDHRLRTELHVPDPCTRKPEHPVECGGDPHVALLAVADRRTASRLPQKPAAAGHPAGAQPARRSPSGNVNGVAEPRAARQAALVARPRPIQHPHSLQGIRPLDPGFGPAIWHLSRQGRHCAHVSTKGQPAPPDSPPNDEESRIFGVDPNDDRRR